MSCMWKNTGPSKNTVCGSVNKAPVAPVAVFHIRVQSVHKHLQMTSPSLSTVPLVHAVTHFIVLANSSSRRWLFAKVTSGKHKKPSKKGWQDRKCGMILRQLLFLSGALSVNEKMLMSGVCVCVVVWLPQDVTSISIWAWTIINQGADVGFFQCRGFHKDEWEKIGWRKARQQHPKVMCFVKDTWSHVKVTPMQKHIGRFELCCITYLLIDLCDRMAS